MKETKVQYIKCPRCELNYILKKDKFCDVCKSEMKAGILEESDMEDFELEEGLELCPICKSPVRNSSLICVVENVESLMAIEKTNEYKGLYHVLQGLISPMDGIGPSDLKIAELIKRVEEGNISEVIFALSPTMEGDTTNFFISRKLSAFNIKMSVIARGITIGNNLEYADEVSLGRSIVDRTPFI